MYSTEQIKNAWELANSYGIKYFSSVGSNAKTIKSDKKTDYLTAIMYMSPSDQAGKGYNTCPMASAGCRAACLFTAGKGGLPTVKEARIRRTKFYFDHFEEFKICLFDELNKHKTNAKKQNKKLAFRFSGTSDIVIEKKIPEFFDYFNDIQWYDYSKLWQRFMPEWQLPNNYHLTFSKSESNQKYVQRIIDVNPYANIAVVFDKLPQEYMGREVINGDEYDARFLDPVGVIVGLKAKGDARYDTSGFVIRMNKQIPIKIKGKLVLV